MNVLMLDPSAYTPYYDYSLCRALAGLGHRVVLATTPYRYDRLPAPDGFELRHLYFRAFDVIGRRASALTAERPRQVLKALEYPLDQLALLRLARRLKPDVVHVQWSLRPGWDLWLLRRLRSAGARLVLTAHDLLPLYAPQDRQVDQWRSFAALYALADAVIVHTQANRNELLTTFPVDAAKVRVIPQGNLTDFVGPATPPSQARAEFGLDPTTRVVLFFGLIKPYKGLDHLVRAFATVRQRVTDARLLIVGQANEDFTRYRCLIDQLGLADSVVTDLRYVPHAEMARVFGAADVVALPYVRTYQSAVLFAAYTFGRALVVTATGGLAETIGGDETGLVVPPADPDALAGALVELLSDPARYHRLGERAYELARTKYAWPGIARQTEKVLLSVASNHKER
jgi:glycosyltransferase involved in cell wall biosynthesis